MVICTLPPTILFLPFFLYWEFDYLLPSGRTRDVYHFCFIPQPFREKKSQNTFTYPELRKLFYHPFPLPPQQAISDALILVFFGTLRGFYLRKVLKSLERFLRKGARKRSFFAFRFSVFLTFRVSSLCFPRRTVQAEETRAEFRFNSS